MALISNKEATECELVVAEDGPSKKNPRRRGRWKGNGSAPSIHLHRRSFWAHFANMARVTPVIGRRARAVGAMPSVVAGQSRVQLDKGPRLERRAGHWWRLANRLLRPS